MFADHVTSSEGFPWDQTEMYNLQDILGPIPLAK